MLVNELWSFRCICIVCAYLKTDNKHTYIDSLNKCYSEYLPNVDACGRPSSPYRISPFINFTKKNILELSIKMECFTWYKNQQNGDEILNPAILKYFTKKFITCIDFNLSFITCYISVFFVYVYGLTFICKILFKILQCVKLTFYHNFNELITSAKSRSWSVGICYKRNEKFSACRSNLSIKHVSLI